MEIAMEKIGKMPGLTPEELARQKEKEYGTVGEAIATRYLDGSIREADISFELGKHHGDEARIVKRAFMLRLCQSIDPVNIARSRRALDGICRLAGTNPCLEQMKQEWETIFHEFGEAIEKRYAPFETMEKKRLRRLGISGSAVRPNVKESEDWRQELEKIRHSYDSPTDELRKRTMRCTATE